jgi:hypothetical protein
MFPDIAPASHQTVQVLYQMQELFVSRVIIKRDDGDTIFKLVAKRVDSIINDD